MIYIIQVIGYTGIMLLVYVLLLRNKPVHTLNRAYLLLCTVLPLVLPLLKVPALVQNKLGGVMLLRQELPEVLVKTNAAASGQYALPGILMVYLAGCLLFAGVLIWKLYKVLSIISKGKKIRKDGYTLLLNTGFGPGSFLRYVLLPEDEVHDTIIRHEYEHVRLHHTKDIIWIDLLQVFCWPNIFLIWIRKELQMVHEFQADAFAKFHAGTIAYAELLVSSVFDTCTLPLTHSFIIHPIKRRIIMLKKHSSLSQRMRLGLSACTMTVLMTGAIVGLQSCTQQVEQVKPATLAATQAEPVLTSAEVMPKFPGDSLPAYLGHQIKYPVEAQQKKIEGRVNVQFVITSDGSVIDARVVGKTQPDPLLCNEALRVVNAMPKWIPGQQSGKKVSVMYTLPISFKLEQNDADNRNGANVIKTLMKSNFVPVKMDRC